MILAVCLISLLFYYLYRSVMCVIALLLIVAVSLLSTIGIMAAFHVPMKTPTQILPTFLVVVGVCDTVHILSADAREGVGAGVSGNPLDLGK